MGGSRTTKYRVEVLDRSGYKWATAFPFKASQKNLETWAETLSESILRGVNQHLGEGALPVRVQLIAQKGPKYGQVVFEKIV